MSSGSPVVVRGRLIEAAAEAYRTCPHSSPRHVGEWVLDTVLPLLADEIIQRIEARWGAAPPEAGNVGYGFDASRQIVASLAAEVTS